MLTTNVWEEITKEDNYDLINYLPTVVVQKNKLLKWKFFSNQFVCKDCIKKVFYKVYEGDLYDSPTLFYSLLRHKLLDIYKKKYKLNWKIETKIINDKVVDLETREELEIDTQCNFIDILNSYKKIHNQLQESFNLKDILKQIKKNSGSYFDVDELILVRDCVNKNIDYGKKNGQFFLLDDADFVICMIDENKNIIKKEFDKIKIFVEGIGECYLQPLTRQINITNFHCDNIFWVIHSNVKNDNYNKNDFQAQHDTMIQKNIRVLSSEKDYTSEEYLNEKILLNEFLSEEEEKELYLHNYKKKTMQWELWGYCNQKCSFCYLGKENNLCDAKKQERSLKDLELVIDKFPYKEYNNISLIGGEFFQGEISNKDIELIFLGILKKIGNLYKHKKIGSFWLTVTLTKKEQNLLFTVLDMFKMYNYFETNKKYNSSGLWLCTSWDSKGRFHTKEQRENWENNMLKIHKFYPFIKLNTTIILTGDFIDLYLNDEINFTDFENKYNTCLFFKQPTGGIKYHPDLFGYSKEKNNWAEASLLGRQKMNEDLGFEFFPQRKKFIDFLKKVYYKENKYYDKLYNMNYRADELVRHLEHLEFGHINKRDKKEITEDGNLYNQNNICNHSYSFCCYSDSLNGCCLCDKNIIKECL